MWIPITNCFLASILYSSLYTNINQQDALEALRWALQEKTYLKTKFLLQAFDFAMGNNFFWHGKKFYGLRKEVAG